METQFIKLGRIIPAIVLVLVLGAVGFNIYKRSFSFKVPEGKGKKLLPENVSASTEGFTYLQTEQGKPKFEIAAKVNLGFKDNKNLFEDVTVKIFGKDGSLFDTITSRQCEFDQAKGEITFLGNVIIKLSEIISKSTGRNGKPFPDDKLATIRVERINYVRSTGAIETEEDVAFTRGKIHGKSRGLFYDSNRQSLRLKAAVEILVEPASSNQAPVEIHSSQLDYEKPLNQVVLRSQVSVKRGPNMLSADLAQAFLRAEDSSVARIEAAGRVKSMSQDSNVLLQSDSDQATYVFDKTGRWLEKTVLRGAVRIHSLDPALQRQLTSDSAEIVFKPRTNIVQTLQAAGNAVLIFHDAMPASVSPPPLFRPSAAQSFECCNPGDKRLTSPEMVAYLRDDGKAFSTIKTRGVSMLEEFPLKGDDKKRVLTGKLFILNFDRGTNRLEKFHAERQVKVEIFPSTAPTRVTTSDTLDALFERQTGQILQLIQAGHFKYVEADRQAVSATATYYVEQKRLLLEGQPQMRDTKLRTTADKVEFLQAQNLMKAWGNIRSVFENQEPNGEVGPFRANSPVYASSDYLEVHTLEGKATYQAKAKLWQGDQLVRAETIELYRKERKMIADKSVKSIFYSENDAGKTEKARKERKPITVTADHLKYEGSLEQATYRDNVQVWDEMGTMKSKQLDVYFVSESGKKTVQKMRAQGDVEIHQPGRDSWSESAEFFQLGKKVILEGGSPRIADSARGSTSGARLTLFIDDGSILVEGDSKKRSFTTQRVTR